jgi:hypothetical protein
MKRCRAQMVFGPLLLAFLISGQAQADQGYPYYPSLIRWEKSQAPFTPPAECGGCHPEQFEEWSGSLHALAFLDPLYQGELHKAVNAVGHEVARQCEGCHSPAGMVTGEIAKPGLAGLGPVALAGVSCDMCHSISGITHWQTPSHEPENGSFILNPGEDGETGPVLIKRGPYEPERYCGVGFHDCIESPLHQQAELCASCHQVYHYDKHFPFEATYLEWKHGPYALRNITCQDCHMVETATFIRSADEYWKPARHEYRHYFNGANYLLYSLATAAANKKGDQELAANLHKKYTMAVARLQAAADLEVSPVYRHGKLAEIKVRVKNIRAGHNLPTSLTNVRQMWLEIKAMDENGKVLFTSGTFDENGRLPENTRLFNSDGMDDNFHFALDPWAVTAFSRHETIPPKGYKDVYYGLTVPDDIPVLTVKVKLRYRQADQKVAAAILANVPKDMDLEQIYGWTKVPAMPVVDMAVREVTITGTQPE